MMLENQTKFYIREVLLQSEHALRAYEWMNAARGNVKEFFFFAHAFLSHQGMLAKLLFASDDNKPAGKRAEALRNALDVEEHGPINNRAVRNGFEHFDERLDAWCKNKNGVYYRREYSYSWICWCRR